MSERAFSELVAPERLLLGPGPSNVHPAVYKALGSRTIGHLDPAFLKIMDETQDLLRRVFQTRNVLTFPVSGTGSAGMEAALCNLIEPGDNVVVGVNGVFGQRMTEVAARCGANVVAVTAPWGEIIQPEAMRAALRGLSAAKLLALVHAETSTGALQPLEEIARIAHDHGAFFVVDTVTSLGGVEVKVDDWGIDVCYSGTQKCLSCPPGLAPITFNEQALDAIRARKTKVQSWYLDVTMIGSYWGGERVYHHTAPINMVYGLREALRLVVEEGLEARFARHRRVAAALWAGLEAMGLTLHVDAAHRLPPLTTVRVPDGVDELQVRRALLNEHGIEIGAGMGELRGKVWRIGLMGESCRPESLQRLLPALEQTLAAQGYAVKRGAGLESAEGRMG